MGESGEGVKPIAESCEVIEEEDLYSLSNSEELPTAVVGSSNKETVSRS